ncbi:MAG: hypothetical protein HZB16_08820 [Armatimonadetes bacterium]|nr:hypothetical protein [Armatimonadota bacterium]
MHTVLYLACAAGLAAGEPLVIDIDRARTVVPSMLGYGVQWDPYEYPPSDDAWALTLRRMEFMRPAIVRVMFGARSYCLGVGADGQPDYIWTRDETAIRARLKWLLAILDYAQAKGIRVMLGEWAPPGRVGEQTIGTPDHPLWARLAADCCRWLREVRGYSVVRYYNLMNEPNGDWMWPGGKVNRPAWETGIRQLRRELDARGLRDLAIVGPDNAWGWDWIDRASATMAEQFGGWEMHWYAGDREVLDGRIEALLADQHRVVLANDPAAASKPFFMGEVGLVEGKTNGDQQPRVKTFPYGVFMADIAAQIGRAGWHGGIAWDLDDALHSANGHAVPPTDTTLKVWGFWNTQGSAMGHPEDEAIRPWFTPWSLLCRLFPGGSAIVAAAQPDLPGLRTLAGVHGDMTAIMVVNNSDEVRRVTVRVPGVGPSAVTQWRYFEGDRPVDADGFPLPTGPATQVDLQVGLPLSMPGRGVVFIQAQQR